MLEDDCFTALRNALFLLGFQFIIDLTTTQKGLPAVPYAQMADRLGQRLS